MLGMTDAHRHTRQIQAGGRHDVTPSIVFPATARDVDTVLIGGRVVERDSRSVGVALAGMLDRSEECAAAVLHRAGAIRGPDPPERTGAAIAAHADVHLARTH